MSEATNEQPWGRVDESRTVFVREGDSEREVGQFPDGTPEEAMAYFVRKFADLEGQVILLEARINRGTAGAEASAAVNKLHDLLVEPAAVGDLATLRTRVAALQEKVGALSEQQQAEREAAKADALAARESIIAEAERLAAQPDAQVRWKETSQAFEQLFHDWQTAQRGGPHLPKAQADALWKRFRSARQTFDSARRAHFAELDATNKDVKHRKERLIAQAEGLAPRGIDAIPAYRALLDEWKTAGRASRKLDDQLWSRFKAAGDVLYQAKAAEVALQDEEYTANLQAKEALLTEGEAIRSLTDRTEARKQLSQLQLRWDEVGRVPRDAVRDVEGRMRAIEAHVKQLEDEHWRASNPETKARSEGLRGQLETSIAELTAQIAATSDPKARSAAEAKLATQRSWLEAIGN